MNQQRSNRLFYCSLSGWLLLTVFVSSCGSSDSSPGTQVKPPTTEPETDLTQQQIEAIAEQSLKNASIEGDFTFNNQRSIQLGLSFSYEQVATKLSIYGAFDTQNNLPTNLLEQVVIIQSTHYKTHLSISSDIESIFIVKDEDENNAIKISLDRNSNISYHFEEY